MIMNKIKTIIPRPQLPIVVYYREDDDADKAVLSEMFSENVYRLEGYKIGSDNPVVLDIGANIGTFTLLVLSLAHAQNIPVTVYAVEPEENNLELLKENLDANPRLFEHGSSVIILEVGVSDFSGKSRITNQSGGSRLSDGEDLQEIDIVTYDELIKANDIDKIDFVKIDIEGSEYPLINGASRKNLLRAHYYAIEWDTQNTKETFTDILNPFLDDFSFQTWGVPNNGCNLYLENHSWNEK